MGPEEKRQKHTASSPNISMKTTRKNSESSQQKITAHCFAYSTLGLESPIKKSVESVRLLEEFAAGNLSFSIVKKINSRIEAIRNRIRALTLECSSM